VKRLLPLLAASILIVMLALLGSPASAQDETGWTQFQGGSSHPGAAAGPVPGYRSAWTIPFTPGGPGERFGLSAPVIADGNAIAVGPETIVATDLASGTTAWSLPRELGPSVPGAVARIDGEAAFIATEGWGDGPPADPRASPTTTPTSSSPSASAAPGTDDDTFAGPSRLVATSIGDDRGTERWSVDLPEVSRTGVLIVGPLAVVGTNDGTVTAVDVATGDVAWTADAGRALDVTPASDGETIVAPVVGGDTSGSSVVAFAVDDGSERWRFSSGSRSAIAGPPAIADGAAYVGFPDRRLVAIDLATGQERWTATLNGNPALSPPVPAGTVVYVVDTSTFGSQVYALDRATGERTWDHPLRSPIVRVAPLALGDAVVIGTLEGDLVAFDAEGNETFRRGGVGPLRALASDGETLVAVRGGEGSGLEAFVHDPAAALTAIASPTDPQPLALAGTWAIAAVVVTGLALLLGRAIEPASLMDEEPVDPLEDDGDEVDE
jgi:outer membrane protein assembly factor BamB